MIYRLSRSQRHMPKSTKTAFDIVTTIAGMSGLRLDRSAIQIGATFLLIALSFFLSRSLIANSEEALIYVVVIWCIYYAGHIIFYKARLHHHMHHRLGRERAWTVYEAGLGVVFFNQGWCVVIFLQHYSSSLNMQTPHLLIFLVGAITFLISTVTKVWATLLVGMDVYYCRDLFLDEASDGGLVTTGPYSIFSNPMYGVGNLSLYGAAIEAGSLEGLLVAIIFQVSIYLFYGMVELPFIRRVYSSHD
tara:strand:- start:623 stop:1363 length:741 start_codon:yes stop_codon:yes gene_type:complete